MHELSTTPSLIKLQVKEVVKLRPVAFIVCKWNALTMNKFSAKSKMISDGTKMEFLSWGCGVHKMKMESSYVQLMILILHQMKDLTIKIILLGKTKFYFLNIFCKWYIWLLPRSLHLPKVKNCVIITISNIDRAIPIPLQR